MKTTGKQTSTIATSGVAIGIKDAEDLENAILITKTGHRSYQPGGAVASINEGRKIAKSDLRCRMKDLRRGGTPACPGRSLM